MPTVLIVDDHPAFRASARRLLESEGYAVVGEAGDGYDAVERALQLDPDLVLLDIQLPGQNGFEVARELQRSGSNAAVVLVSSREEADYGTKVAESGALGFIAKGDLSGTAIDALLE